MGLNEKLHNQLTFIHQYRTFKLSRQKLRNVSILSEMLKVTWSTYIFLPIFIHIGYMINIWNSKSLVWMNGNIANKYMMMVVNKVCTINVSRPMYQSRFICVNLNFMCWIYKIMLLNLNIVDPALKFEFATFVFLNPRVNSYKIPNIIINYCFSLCYAYNPYFI